MKHLKDKQCQQCGKAMQQVDYRKKICHECRGQNARNYMRKYSASKHKNGKPRKDRYLRECASCKKSILMTSSQVRCAECKGKQMTAFAAKYAKEKRKSNISQVLGID